MLQRDESGNSSPNILTTHGFVFDVICDQNAPSADVIGQKVADALMWVEGCGEVNIGYLGPMDPETET